MAGLINSDILRSPARPRLDFSAVPPAKRGETPNVQATWAGAPKQQTKTFGGWGDGSVPDPRLDSWGGSEPARPTAAADQLAPSPRSPTELAGDIAASLAPGADDYMGKVAGALPGVSPRGPDSLFNNTPTLKMPTPPTPPTPPRGVLEDPGAGELEWENSKGHISEPGDAKLQALIDEMSAIKAPGSGNLDEYYQNAWEHSARDINNQFAGRGMFGSGDALRSLSHSRTDLGAEQANREFDAAMESFKSDTSRLGTAGQLQGGLMDTEINRVLARQTGAKSAQLLEEGRVRGQVDDELNAFDKAFGGLSGMFDDMSDSDKELVMARINNHGAPPTNAANLDAAQNEESDAAWAAFIKMIAGGGGA